MVCYAQEEQHNTGSIDHVRALDKKLFIERVIGNFPSQKWKIECKQARSGDCGRIEENFGKNVVSVECSNWFDLRLSAREQLTRSCQWLRIHQLTPSTTTLVQFQFIHACNINTSEDMPRNCTMHNICGSRFPPTGAELAFSYRRCRLFQTFPGTIRAIPIRIKHQCAA